jgi:hypothetical protein
LISPRPFDPTSWPEGSAVAAALQECREAQRAFDKANTVLSPADRKLLEVYPGRFLMQEEDSVLPDPPGCENG